MPDPILPLFPLPGVFLFPGQVMPLHIFEPRYRQLVEDLLDGPGRLVIGTILEHHAHESKPSILPIAGLGEIARHEKQDDGRFNILLFGLARVRVEEIDSEHPYRLVRCSSWSEDPPTPERAEGLKSPLIDAIQLRTGFPLENLEGVSTAQLVDVLAQCLAIPQANMAAIFTEPRIEERAQRVLAAHSAFPPKDQPGADEDLSSPSR